MARLPIVDGDDGQWGDILNDFLLQAHNSNGTIRNTGIVASKYTKPGSGIPKTDLTSAIQTSLELADSSVQDVNGHSGPNVTVTKNDITLGNVDNTSDADKPISTATQSALDSKQDAATATTDTEFAAHTDATTTVHGISDTAAIKGVVNHGADSGVARPGGFASVEWIGSVEPTNGIDGDTWVNTA